MTALDARPVVVPDDAEPRPNKRPRHIKGTRPGWFIYACLAVVMLASVFPFYWSLLIGSGDSYTIRDPNMSWIPGGNFFANAAKVVSSALIAASVVFFSTLAGWAFAKLRFRGSSWLLVFVIATMAVPTQLGVVPLYILFSDLGWTGQLGAIIVPALVSAFGVFWMTQYLRQAVPDELIEAARVDGASSFRTFLTVGLPAARPAAAMLALFTFVSAWNNFFWPFIVLDRQNPTLPVALSLLQSNYFVDYSIVLAGVLLATIPLLILFVFAGKQLVSGIMQGAVKG